MFENFRLIFYILLSFLLVWAFYFASWKIAGLIVRSIPHRRLLGTALTFSLYFSLLVLVNGDPIIGAITTAIQVGLIALVHYAIRKLREKRALSK